MNKNLTVEICPVKQLYYRLPEEKRKACAIIASSYDVRLSKLEKLESKIIFSFADVTEHKNPLSFNEEHARQIHQYADNLPDVTEVLFVCCDSGESRSSAIAAAITKYFGGDEMKIWRDPRYHPNGLVYKLLCREFGLPASDDEVNEKIRINDNALSEAINRARKRDS